MNAMAAERTTALEDDPAPDPRLLYWTQDDAVRNFGDFLSLMLVERALVAPQVPADRYRLIGSAIDDTVLATDLRQSGDRAATIACWGCGARSDTGLSDETAKRTMLFGVRGPLSRDALRLAADTPLGDPALLLPLLYAPGSPEAGQEAAVLCVPHFHEPLSDETILARTGVDAVASPRVVTLADCEALIDRIAAAELVLAGSLHAAIVAFAYGTPFAFLDLGFVDTAFKWHDFAALIGIEARWFETAAEARPFAIATQERARWPSVSPLLACCPWSVRPEVTLAALNLDRGHGHPAPFPMTDERFVALAREAHRREFARQRDRVECALARESEAAARMASAIGEKLGIVRDELLANAEAARFRFRGAQGQANVLTFAAGDAGSAMLRGRWVEPNAVAPMTWASLSRVVLPAQSGWAASERLLFEGYLYAPHVAPLDGRRRLTLFVDGAPAFDAILANPGNEESFVARIEVPLAPGLRARGGELELHFVFAEAPTPLELGLSTHDDRPIGYAPLRLWIT